MVPSRSSSTSPPTSRSTSPVPQEKIQLFIKSLSGETIPMNLPTSTPISTLTTLLSLRTSLPASSLRLVHAGRHLNPTTTVQTTTPPFSPSIISSHSPTSPTSTTSNISTTLADFHLPPTGATLHLTTPLRGGMAPSKKQRCTFKECRDAAQRIIGDCAFCEGHFCGRHRLLEDHRCEGLEDCKRECHERNKEQLERESTVVIKGI